MRDIAVRRARGDESDTVAALVRLSKETAMPFLPNLHTPGEDRAFFRDRAALVVARATYQDFAHRALVRSQASRPSVTKAMR